MRRNNGSLDSQTIEPTKQTLNLTTKGREDGISWEYKDEWEEGCERINGVQFKEAEAGG